MSRSRRVFGLIEFVGVIGMLATGGAALWEVSISSLVLGPLTLFLTALALASKSPPFLGSLALFAVGAFLKDREEKRAQADSEPDYDLTLAEESSEQRAVIAAPVGHRAELERVFETITGYASLGLGLTVVAATLWLFSGGAIFDFGRMVLIAVVCGSVMLIGWLGARWCEK